MSKAVNGHDLQGVDTVAHDALKLAKELQKKMDKSLLEGVLEKSKYGITSLLVMAGVTTAALLGTATGRMYMNNAQLATNVYSWEIAIYMAISTVALGIYLWLGISHMILGNYVVYYSLFISTFALAIGIFMTIIAVQSRTLRG